MKKQLAAWLVLGIITLVAGFSLSMTNEVTKGPIENQALLAEASAKQAVLPAAEAFEVIALPEDASVELFAGVADGETVGYVGKVTVNGYGGPIDVIAGVDETGLVKGVNVGGSAFAETAGLGAKARETAFTDQFIDKVSPIRVVKAADPKTESSVDAITAATITTNAVAGGVNRIARQVSDLLNPEEPQLPVAEGTTYTASQQGFAGQVAVFVTVKDDGTISALKVGDAQFAETDGYGAHALEDDFTSQFVGKALPVSSEDIDGISGATFTTNAVLAAINQAYEEKNVVAEAAAEGTEYPGQAQGFAGPVAVVVTLKEDGSISKLAVGDDQFMETDGYGANALERDFTDQFVGKVPPLALRQADEEVSASTVDGISAATITSQAVVDAINEAVSGQEAVVPEETETVEPEVEPEPVVETEVSEDELKTGEAQGFAGPVLVQVAFNEDGSIKSLAVGDERFAETPGLGTKAQDADFTDQFAGKMPPLALRKADEEVSASNVDAVTGATVTSQAVVDAVNAAAGDQDADEAAPADEDEMKTGEAQGFVGPVLVQVAFNEDGSIKSLAVGDERFAETPGLGTKAQDADFTDQFAGKMPPLALRKADEEVSASNVDAVTGATVTSQAVVDAVNQAHEQINK